MSDIILYGAEWCPSCQQLKKMLEAQKKPFEYRDVDDKKWMRELADLGIRSIPFAIINGKKISEPTPINF